MKAAAAVVVLVLSAAAVVTSVAVHASAKKTRAAIHEPRRLVWEDHAADLNKRKLFRRMYRMEEPVFNKLAGLLEPILQRNDYYARKRYQGGAVPTKIRLAIGLRMMAGASYLDVAVLFGVSKETVFSILWQVVDAINSTAEVGPFFFPQSEDECTRQAAEWEEKSTGGAFQGVVAAGDGLFVKTLAPTALNTPNVLSYYSGSKCGYGMNVQATCDANYRFCSMSCIAPGSTNDWTAWNHSDLSTAVKNLPPGFYMLGDAAYPLSDHLLTPYPGRGLPLDKDAFNFYLSQLRVRIEQAFGILVGQWGILWKPLRVQFAGRCDFITALFRLHNYLRDEKVTPIHRSEEDAEVVQVRPHLLGDKTLPGTFSTTTKTTKDAQKPTRSGEVSTRKGITMMLDNKRQYRPKHDLVRNAARKT
ncbi:unnamed protein product [Ectocarpus sp. CCAP 1310/34]|nr:unnamed protein product [Ectocarpus sp. CCAP 1310/34]